MLNKELLIALTIIASQPITTHAITKNTVLGLSTGAGALGLAMTVSCMIGTESTNQTPNEISNKFCICAMTSAATAAFCYWMLQDLTPEARLEKAAKIHQKLLNDPLLSYGEDSDEYLQHVELQYIQNTYPLLKAFDHLKATLEQAIANNNLLAKALHDTYQGTPINNRILQLRSETNFLIKMIKKDLLIIKRNPNFIHQHELSQKLELLERQVIAEERKASLLAQQVVNINENNRLRRAELSQPKIVQINLKTKNN